MVSVRINGSESAIDGNRLSRFTELIELIKSTIDPEHMITNILLNGRELSEHDWNSNIPQLGTAIVEVETGTPDDFVTHRLACSSDIVRSCFLEFRDARKCFQSGEMLEGNQRLLKAVNTAKAFFDWYATLMEIVPESKKQAYNIDSQVSEISEICKRLCQQQLYQSWWALGETLEKELEPKLDKLEDHCRRFSKQT